MIGRIKKVNVERGFGFIIVTGPRSSSDYFFHETDLEDISIKSLKVGDEVEFEDCETDKGLRAEYVRLV